MKVIKLDLASENKIRATVLKGEMQKQLDIRIPIGKSPEKFHGYIWTIIEGDNHIDVIETAIICANGIGEEEVSAVLLPDYTIARPDCISLVECLEIVYAEVIYQQTNGHPVNNDMTVHLERKDGAWLAVNRVTYRLRRIRKLKDLNAPKWIIKYEQVLCIWNRTGRYREDLVQKYVAPIMGQDSITVPDPDGYKVSH